MVMVRVPLDPVPSFEIAVTVAVPAVLLALNNPVASMAPFPVVTDHVTGTFAVS
jgi:hypothetical protein